jgi:hypothetical protein
MIGAVQAHAIHMRLRLASTFASVFSDSEG